MGFNYDGLRAPLVVDIETVAHPCALDFLEPLDLSTIQAARNLKDPVKIADDLAKRKADATIEYAEKVGRCALDWNLSRIVALAWSADLGETVDVRVCPDEAEEAAALEAFWQASEGRLLLGFAARTFDLPTLIQRSRLLGVGCRQVNLARYGKGSVIDVRDVLTFDDARYEALMPRSLKVFCRRFGIPVEDAIDGADVGALVAAGDFDSVVAHVSSDVRLTARLAQRIGVLTTEPAGVF